MILYVKSTIEPVFEKWVWHDRISELALSFRGLEITDDLFDKEVCSETKIKFKFIKNNSGLLIDFDSSNDVFPEYGLYLGNTLYCKWTISERKYNITSILESNCNYFVLRYSLDNRYLRYNQKGFTNSLNDTVHLGVADVVNNLLLGVPTKTNLSKDKKKRYYFALLNNDNKREKTLQLCNAVKVGSNFKEIDIGRLTLFSYFCVWVNIESSFKNKGGKIKLL